MRVSKITVARLFNLGNYEHKRVEITVETDPSWSDARPSRVVSELEDIAEKLGPKVQNLTESIKEDEEQAAQYESDILTEGESNREYYTTQLQNTVERLKANKAKLEAAKLERDAALARLDALGGYITRE